MISRLCSFPGIVEGSSNSQSNLKKICSIVFYITCHNMLWVLTVLSQLWFGFEIIAWWLPRKFEFVHILFLSMPFGFLVSSIIVFCLSPILGLNLFHMILHTIGLCLFSAFMFTQRNKKKYLRVSLPSVPDFIVIFISLIFSSYLFSKFYFSEPRVLNSVCFFMQSGTFFI